MTEADDEDFRSLPGKAWGQSDSVAAYERGRPGYAPQAVATLATTFHLVPESTILDLAAGTGKLTRQLTRTGARVVAVEPSGEMRARFSQVLPGVPIFEGSAETIPLPTGSVDLIVVGQAWHWFDGPAAQAEAGRVLVPGGGLALLWNDYDVTVPWVRELADIRNRHFSHRLPPQIDHDWQADFAARSDWQPMSERSFDHVHQTTRDALVDRVLSTSVIAGLPARERGDIRQEVLAILDRYEETHGRECLAVPYQTSLYWTRHG